MTINLEVCVDSAEGLAAAVAGGADRIELCSALDLGGLTPSPGLMRLAAKAPIPIYAMIRPRVGDFVYDDDNVAAMLAEIDQVRSCGLAGVVVGANRGDGCLDVGLLSRLIEHAGGLGVTLHRAFDLVPDPFEALEQAVGLGVERILTSGLAVTAPEAIELIGRLVRQSDGRLSIMPGSGINAGTVTEVAATGIMEVHASCRSVLPAADPRLEEFGFQPAGMKRTSEPAVRHLRGVLDAL